MPSIGTLCTFVIAALLLAAMPGPGLLYIAGRTLALGRKQGFASCLGAAVGGAVHVIAGVIGVSALDAKRDRLWCAEILWRHLPARACGPDLAQRVAG